MTTRAEWFGDRAVLVTVPAPNRGPAFAAHLAWRLPHHSVRAGMRTVLVEAAVPDARLLSEVLDVLSAAERGDHHPDAGERTIEIAVLYEGSDLSEVAAVLGCTGADVVAAHQAQAWSVAMMGFAPGFGYLVPTGPGLLDWGALQRRARPRERVPAGSVALAAGMSAVYPAAMPGGWHLVGTTRARLFDPLNHTDPTLLRPGARVRFRAVDG